MGALMRSRSDRKIGGVCGGLARQNGWDPTVVRLIWLALILFGGTGVLVYIVMWIVVPEEPFALPPYTGYAPPPVNYAPPASYAPQAQAYGAPPVQAGYDAGGSAYPGVPPPANPGAPRQG